MVTLEQAAKVLEVVDCGLTAGMGIRLKGEMCVEAAVCYAFGLPHGDNPPCVDPILREFKIGLNDKPWSSKEARAKGMRKLAVAQLGSNDTLDSYEFIKKLSDRTIRVILPRALREFGFDRMAVQCEVEGIVGDINNISPEPTFSYLNEAIRYARKLSSTTSLTSANYISSIAHWSAGAIHHHHPDRKNYDLILTLMADLAVDVLRELNAPGIKLMDQLIPQGEQP